MITVNIEEIAIALFQTIPSYLEFSTGRTMAGFVIPENKKNISAEYMRLPSFSIAYVKQIYLIKKYGVSYKIKEHGLDTYPTFSLLSNDEQHESEAIYNQKSHWFIVDHGLEDEYIEFSENYRKECAIKWCVDNEINYCSFQ